MEDEIDETMNNMENDLAFLGDLSIIKNAKARRRCNIIGHFLILCLIILMSSIQLATKVYSGEETFSQIIYTIILGIWLSFYLFFTVRVAVCKHIRRMLEFTQAEMSQQQQLEHKLMAIKRALITFVVMVVILISTHIMVYAISVKWPLHHDWI